MKDIFKKSHLPFLSKVIHGEGDGREDWWLARLTQDRNGISHHGSTEFALLMRGAAKGDSYSHCEFARYLYRFNKKMLPNALSFWHKAIRVGDAGALWDIANLPIYSDILAYTEGEGNEYGDIEMKCVMLTEWILTDMGRTRWAL